MKSVVEAATGEVLIEGDGAPDRNAYPETDAGYYEYLADAEQWARAEYWSAVKRLRLDAEHLEQAAKDLPEVGDNRPKAEEKRDEEDECWPLVAESFADVAESRKRLERLEEASGGR